MFKKGSDILAADLQRYSQVFNKRYAAPIELKPVSGLVTETSVNVYGIMTGKAVRWIFNEITFEQDSQSFDWFDAKQYNSASSKLGTYGYFVYRPVLGMWERITNDEQDLETSRCARCTGSSYPEIPYQVATTVAGQEFSPVYDLIFTEYLPTEEKRFSQQRQATVVAVRVTYDEDTDAWYGQYTSQANGDFAYPYDFCLRYNVEMRIYEKEWSEEFVEAYGVITMTPSDDDYCAINGEKPLTFVTKSGLSNFCSGPFYKVEQDSLVGEQICLKRYYKESPKVPFSATNPECGSFELANSVKGTVSINVENAIAFSASPSWVPTERSMDPSCISFGLSPVWQATSPVDNCQLASIAFSLDVTGQLIYFQHSGDALSSYTAIYEGESYTEQKVATTQYKTVVNNQWVTRTVLHYISVRAVLYARYDTGCSQGIIARGDLYSYVSAEARYRNVVEETGETSSLSANLVIAGVENRSSSEINPTSEESVLPFPSVNMTQDRSGQYSTNLYSGGLLYNTVPSVVQHYVGGGTILTGELVYQYSRRVVIAGAVSVGPGGFIVWPISGLRAPVSQTAGTDLYNRYTCYAPDFSGQPNVSVPNGTLVRSQCSSTEGLAAGQRATWNSSASLNIN